MHENVCKNNDYCYTEMPKNQSIMKIYENITIEENQ